MKQDMKLPNNRNLYVCVFAVICFSLNVATSEFARGQDDRTKPPRVAFIKQQLDTKFRSEGVAVLDVNKDGKLDIAAGYVWYEAPDWKLHTIVEKAPEYQPKGYANSFCTFARDLNMDGWDDIVVVDFPGTPTWWFENPQGKEGPWKKHTIVEVTNNESPQFVDLDGDGKDEFLAAIGPSQQEPDGEARKMAFATPGDKPDALWNIHYVSKPGSAGTRRYSHGLGAGDINGDGRKDILVARGWYECPAENAAESEWAFHEADFGGKAAHMFAYDFDADGDADVLGSSPHDFGIWWYEQTAPNEWKTHEIDKTFSQTHSVWFGDINGDDLPDFVTGKRWWAHGGRDPGGDEAAVMCWFELTRRDGKPRWIRHQFDHDSGVGTQFEVADVNDDGLLDVITSNKKGVFYFEQSRK